MASGVEPRVELLLALALAACGGRAELGLPPPPDGANDPAVACEGRLTATPFVLLPSAEGGALLTDGGHLVLVTPGGRVRRIARCSGQTELLLFPSDAGATAAVTDEFIYVAPAGEAARGVYRGKKDERSVDLLAEDALPTPLLALGSTLYYGSVLGTPEGNTETHVYALRDADETPSHVASAFAPPGTRERLLAVSAAGLYLERDEDCDCTPPLELLSFDADAPVTVDGAGRRGGGPGVYVVAVAGDRLYVAAADKGLRELALEGGEAVEVAPTGAVTALQAGRPGVCWTEDASGGARSAVTLRCARASQPRAVVTLDTIERGAVAFAVADDAVYWLRPVSLSSFELVGAAL